MSEDAVKHEGLLEGWTWVGDDHPLLPAGTLGATNREKDAAVFVRPPRDGQEEAGIGVVGYVPKEVIDGVWEAWRTMTTAVQGVVTETAKILGGISSSLEELSDAVKNTPTYAADREAWRRSFAYGNIKMSNPEVTPEMVDEAAEAYQKECLEPETPVQEEPYLEEYRGFEIQVAQVIARREGLPFEETRHLGLILMTCWRAVAAVPGGREISVTECGDSPRSCAVKKVQTLIDKLLLESETDAADE